jgi:hypothetical protein
MNTWIFQAIPERYDLREKLETGGVVTWLATRYRARMEPGDKVYLWLGGDESIRGIYGQGILASQPFPKPEWEAYGVDVWYIERKKAHIPVSAIRNFPGLQNLLILRAPNATNFLLSAEEAQALAALYQQY